MSAVEVEESGNDAAVSRMIRDWSRGDCRPVEAYRDATIPDLAATNEAILDLIACEIALRQERGELPDQNRYQIRFPDLAEPIRRIFVLESLFDPVDSPRLSVRPPPCGELPDGPAGYRLEAEIGRGQTGVVYRAWRIGDGKTVALKRIHDLGAEEQARFHAQAQVLATLRHPCLVRVESSGEWQGCPFLVLEDLAGGSLADRLKGSSPIQAARLVEALAQGLAEIHRRGIVHRDLKPANILFDEQGTPKIGDFGLARFLDLDPDDVHQESLLGSPAYMAPEQADPGLAPVGPATDIHALGTILYQLLVGHVPYSDPSALRTLELIRSAEVEPPSRVRPEVSLRLSAICLRCLAKLPAQRYGSADELAADLRRFLDPSDRPNR